MKYLKIVFPALTVLVFLLEVWLSHQTGAVSGAQSRAVAEAIRVDDMLLRSASHYGLFFLMALFAGLSLGVWERSFYWLAVIFVWCFLDEATKPMFSGRHFEMLDYMKNVIGTAAGTLAVRCVFGIHGKKKRHVAR